VVLTIICLGPTLAIVFNSTLWWIWFVLPAPLVAIFKIEVTFIVDEETNHVKRIISFFKWRSVRIDLEFPRVIAYDVVINHHAVLEDGTGFAVSNRTILSGYIIKTYITHDRGTIYARFYFENTEKQRAEMKGLLEILAQHFQHTDRSTTGS
jgi:hypothetical protein